MKRIAVRRAVAVLFAGFGLTVAVVSSPVRAEPVPLVKARKPAVSIAAVREAAAVEGTVRAAPEFSPAAFDPFAPSAPAGLPTLSPFPGDAAPRSSKPFETFPQRGGAMPVSTTAFDPFGGSGRGVDPRGPQPNSGGVRGLWNGFTKWTGDRAKSLADAVVGPEQQPDPRVGQIQQPMPPMNYGPPPQGMPMQPFRGVTPNGRPAYAGNPAYRWYGWGTTTPGANPYAPAGEYPNTSSQWYTMSGATPGAFPVPVTNPFRPEPGAGAPVYVANAPTVGGSSVSPPTFISHPSPLPAGPTPIVETRPFRYVPPDELPISSTVPVPSVPPSAMNWRGGNAPAPSKPEEIPVRPTVVEPTWQPIQYAAPAKAPSFFIGQSLPKAASAQSEILQAVALEPVGPVSMLDRVRAAAGSDVRNVEAKRLGRDGVIVRFDAPTDAVAEAAAKAIAGLAELKPYTVTFDVAVGK